MRMREHVDRASVIEEHERADRAAQVRRQQTTDSEAITEGMQPAIDQNG